MRSISGGDASSASRSVNALLSLTACPASGTYTVLTGSYGPQRLTIYAMRPELGVPDVEELRFASEDESWRREWLEFAGAIFGPNGKTLYVNLQTGVAMSVAIWGPWHTLGV